MYWGSDKIGTELSFLCQLYKDVHKSSPFFFSSKKNIPSEFPGLMLSTDIYKINTNLFFAFPSSFSEEGELVVVTGVFGRSHKGYRNLLYMSLRLLNLIYQSVLTYFLQFHFASPIQNLLFPPPYNSYTEHYSRIHLFWQPHRLSKFICFSKCGNFW